MQNVLDEHEYLNTNGINKILYNSHIIQETITIIENNKSITKMTDKIKKAYHNLIWLEELQTIIDIRQYDTST